MDQARMRRLWGALPVGLRARVPLRLEAWARGRAPRAGPGAAGLEARLWGGFSRAAQAELAALAAAGPPAAAAAAAYALARWRAAHGDFAAALDELEAMAAHPPAACDPRRVALAALCLNQTGRGAEARALLAARAGPARELLLAGSWRPAAGEQGPAADAATLVHINALFARYGLQGLAKRDPARPLGLDNVTGADPGPKPSAPGRVSVIVPAWNAAETLATALASLTEQTHGDLELLVVDDASTDATADVAAAAARADPRIRLLRQDANRGGYAGRNLALAAATGAFVTVHDADDWSHPEKIARQLRQLLRTGAPSTFSAWVRTTPELGFIGPARPHPELLGLNDSSALFRRALFLRFGGWDDARIAADKELIWRFEVLAGRPREAFRRRLVLPGCPLAFGRLVPSSLTRTGATHVLTVYHGLRREYREAAAFWQDGLDARAAQSRGLAATPPYFPAPPVIRPAAAPAPARDLAVIADFNFQGGAQKSALAMLAAARAAGLAGALLHYRRYDQDVTAPLRPEVRRFAQAHDVRILAPGEAAAAKTVIVAYPPVFAEAMDRFPALAHQHLVVAVNQLAERDTERRDVAYHPARVRAHLAELLGSEGAWAPISERVRALMAADPRYPAAHPDTWTPLIDAAAWGARAHPWRGDARPRPVLGRHGRDHPLKWPRDAAALRAAYCAGAPCEVRFLGGAAHARARLARWPANWRALPFGAREVPAFLAELDVFLHFPDPGYIEEFGRAPMEAMAAGVPVILPPEFEPSFGEAALYAAARRGLAAGARALARPRPLGGAGGGRARLRRRPLRLRRAPPPPRPTGEGMTPTFSVIVPVYRHWPLVPELLAALAAQTVGADGFEIVIVDNDPDAAPDPPPALPGNARVVPCPAPGAYAARNAGAAAAQGTLARLHRRRLPPRPGLARRLRRRRRTGRRPARRPGGDDAPAGAPERLRRLRPGARHPAGALRRPRLRRHRQPGPAGGAVPRAWAASIPPAAPAATPSSAAAPAAPAHPLTLVPGAVVVHPARAGWAELATKARRVKGGQIRAGPLPRRLAWTLLTLAPPLGDLARLAAAPQPAAPAAAGARGAPAPLGGRARRDRPAACRRHARAALSGPHQRRRTA